MHRSKNGVGKCSFSVVRVRTEGAVALDCDSAGGDAEKGDPDLAQGMKGLSLSGGKNEESPCVGRLAQNKYKGQLKKDPYKMKKEIKKMNRRKSLKKSKKKL
ncbi:unnamed protein product [Urochloa humidicola]